jgi:hypothetical protein
MPPGQYKMTPTFLMGIRYLGVRGLLTTKGIASVFLSVPFDVATPGLNDFFFVTYLVRSIELVLKVASSQYTLSTGGIC